MKLNSFKFQDGKVFWLPEYPEKTISYCSGKPYCCEGRRCDVLQHDDAVAKSLASAIEVAPEDAGKVKKIIFMQNPEVRTARSIFHPGQLENGEVYSAECEMERVEQWALKGTHEWYNDDDERFDLHHPDDTDYRQVARLKPKEEIFPAANSHDMKEEEQQELILSEKIVRVKTVCVPAGLIPDKLVRLLYQYSDDKWYGIQVDGHFENIEIWDSNRIYLLKPTHRQVVIK